MTHTIKTHEWYQLVRCVPKGRPQRLPPYWVARPIDIDLPGAGRTWLLYNPRTHNVTLILGTWPHVLYDVLVRAGCQAVHGAPLHTVYLVRRSLATYVPQVAWGL